MGVLTNICCMRHSFLLVVWQYHCLCLSALVNVSHLPVQVDGDLENSAGDTGILIQVCFDLYLCTTYF